MKRTGCGIAKVKKVLAEYKKYKKQASSKKKQKQTVAMALSEARKHDRI